MTAALLRLADISRTYDDGHPIPALRDVNLSIQPGDYVTITGPSGSGKSTLLNVLGLLDRPDTGDYEVKGINTTRLGEVDRGALRATVFGFVFQSFHLLPGRTAAENIEVGMMYRRLGRRQRKALSMKALDRVGLGTRAHSDPRVLSGGERQRVAIARAVAGRPDIVLCDEPTGNLDSGNTLAVLDLFDRLHADGLTLIVVTHEGDVATRGSVRVAVHDGYVAVNR